MQSGGVEHGEQLQKIVHVEFVGAFVRIVAVDQQLLHLLLHVEVGGQWLREGERRSREIEIGNRDREVK